MNLYLKREPTINETTFGILYIDQHFFCHTLEDAIREDVNKYADPFHPTNSEVLEYKVYGKTAIPSGTYRITLEQFKSIGLRPYLHNVPGFEGIFIHGGINISNTLGCPLVGENRIKEHYALYGFVIIDLVNKLINQDEIYITIENP